MRSTIAVLVLVLAACSSPAPQESAAPAPQADEPVTAQQTGIELGEKPVEVVVPVADVETTLKIARDQKRTLVLRLEGIAVTESPDIVYEVHLAGVAAEVGVLSFYGAKEGKGEYVVVFPVDDAAARVLVTGARELRVIFTPKGAPKTRARIARIVLGEE